MQIIRDNWFLSSVPFDRFKSKITLMQGFLDSPKAQEGAPPAQGSQDSHEKTSWREHFSPTRRSHSTTFLVVLSRLAYHPNQPPPAERKTAPRPLPTLKSCLLHLIYNSTISPTTLLWKSVWSHYVQARCYPLHLSSDFAEDVCLLFFQLHGSNFCTTSYGLQDMHWVSETNRLRDP